MTSERSLAYGRVIKTLEDLGPSKLHDAELRRVRDAADALLFAPDDDSGTELARGDVEALVAALVESGRWTPETATQLIDDVTACGPGFVALSF